MWGCLIANQHIATRWRDRSEVIFGQHGGATWSIHPRWRRRRPGAHLGLHGDPRCRFPLIKMVDDGLLPSRSLFFSSLYIMPQELAKMVPPKATGRNRFLKTASDSGGGGPRYPSWCTALGCGPKNAVANVKHLAKSGVQQYSTLEDLAHKSVSRYSDLRGQTQER